MLAKSFLSYLVQIKVARYRRTPTISIYWTSETDYLRLNGLVYTYWIACHVRRLGFKTGEIEALNITNNYFESWLLVSGLWKGDLNDDYHGNHPPISQMLSISSSNSFKMLILLLHRNALCKMEDSLCSIGSQKWVLFLIEYIGGENTATPLLFTARMTSKSVKKDEGVWSSSIWR